MVHSRTMINKLNSLQKRCLRRVHSDKTSSFEKLLETDRIISTRVRNLEIVATEFFKANKDLTSIIFSEFVSNRSAQYNLRQASDSLFQTIKGRFMVLEVCPI